MKGVTRDPCLSQQRLELCTQVRCCKRATMRGTKDVIVLLPLYRSLAQTLLPLLVLFQGDQCKRREQDAPVSPGRFGLRFYCTTFQFDHGTLDSNYSFGEIDIAPF